MTDAPWTPKVCVWLCMHVCMDARAHVRVGTQRKGGKRERARARARRRERQRDRERKRQREREMHAQHHTHHAHTHADHSLVRAQSFVGKTPQELVEEVPPIPVNGAVCLC